MAEIGDILFSLGLIAFGLSLGYVYRNYSAGKTKSEDEIDELRKKLQATAILFVNPLAFGGAIWALDLGDLRIFALPFLGAFAIILGGASGLHSGQAPGAGQEPDGGLCCLR